MYKKTNFSYGTLSAQLLIGGTSLVLGTGEGDLFPATGSGNTFAGVIWGSTYATPQSDATREIVVAYRASGDTFTIVRGQEGTSAKQWESGDNFMLTATAGVFDEYETALTTHAGLTTGVHGVGAGTVAKTADITATKLDDFATPDDNTDLNANTTNHGLVIKATAPASGIVNVVGITNAETAYTNKPLFDATVPSTQAFGDSAATGTATVSARRDHKHAMPAVSAGSDINTGTDDAKPVTAKAIADSFLGVQGGFSPLGACTYEGADDPTFTFSIASDMTGILSVGMRIRLTQTTVKHFIITAVGAYSGGKTIITVYGGTDYDLANAAITLPYYSTQKAPYGFPMEPTKWSIVVTDGGNRQVGTPTANAYVSVSELSVSIPIGSWICKSRIALESISGGANRAGIAFSSGNTSLAGTYWKEDRYIPSAGQWILNARSPEGHTINHTAKTTYYTLLWTENSGVTSIAARGDVTLGVNRIVCAYL